MNTTIFIPKKISVGFQNRSGTYTGKLAYIIYYDEKGVLRKEKSWNGWRNHDIEPIVADNEPTSGFVLNKRVGGYDTGWNHRNTYCRVYDPRGFEFEITIENLLYILENTSSIKGKGLEGEFVYGWNGKDLILIPTSSPDYSEIMKYNDILQKKEYVKSKDLVLGGTYRTKINEEWIYMGIFDYHDEVSKRVYYGSHSYDYNCIYEPVNKGKHYFFARKDTTYDDKPYLQLLILKSLGQRFIETVSSECVDNYAELYTQLECKTDFSPYDSTKDEYIHYTLEGFLDDFKRDIEYHWNLSLRTKTEDKRDTAIYFDSETNQYYLRGEYKKAGWSGYYEKIFIGSIEDVFNKYQPIYKNKYLANGKFYKKERN